MVSPFFMPIRASSKAAGNSALAELVHTVLDAQSVNGLAVVVFDGHGQLDNALLLDLGVGRSILVVEVVIAQRIDLLVNLKLGSRLERNLHMDGRVIGKLEFGLDFEFCGEGEVFALFHQAFDVAELRLGNHEQVVLVNGQREALVHDLVSNRGTNSLFAEVAVDDGTGHMAGAESGETVLRAEILVGLLDASVDLGSLDGHRELGGTGLENLYLRFQHYPPSESCSVRRKGEQVTS